MDFVISDVFQLETPHLHKNIVSVERELLTFSVGPLSFQGNSNGMVVAGRTDGGISFWRTKERKIKFNKCFHKESILQTTTHHLGPVTALAYCNDKASTFGRPGLLFSGSSDRSIKIWDIWADKAVTETCVQSLVGHGATVSSIIDSQRGFVISCSFDGSVRVWRPKQETSPQLSRKVFFICSQTINLCGIGGNQSLTCMALSLPVSSRNRWSLFIGDSGGNINHFRDRINEEPLKIQRVIGNVHSLSVADLLFIDEHSFLVSVAFDCTCCILESVTGAVVFKIGNGATHFTGLLWDSLADQLLLTDASGILTKWSAFSKQTVGKLILDTPPLQHYIEGDHPLPHLSQLSWIHGQCKSLVVCLPKHATFQQYDIVRESKRSEFFGHMDMVVGCVSMFASSNHTMYSNDQLNFDAERVMVSASTDNTIRVWDSGTRLERYQLLEPSNSEIACMIFVDDLRLLVTGNQDGSMRWWHPDTGPLLCRAGHTNTVSSLCFASVTSLHHSVQEHYLVSGSFDGSIGIWLFNDHGHIELSPLLHERLPAAHGMNSPKYPNEVLCVCFHVQSQLIVSGGNDSKVRCWSASDRQLRLVLDGHSDAVTAVCVAPNRPYLFTGANDAHILVWDLGTTRMKDGTTSTLPPLTRITGNTALRCLLVLPTTPALLVSASADSIVKVWDFSQPPISKESVQQDADDSEDGGFILQEVHEISVDDNVSEPNCLGYLETPLPPVTSAAGEISPGKVVIGILIGMTSGTVIKMSLPSNLG